MPTEKNSDDGNEPTNAIDAAKPETAKASTAKRAARITRPELQLDDWQRKFLATTGNKILCCGRQIGKSTIVAIDAAEYAVATRKEGDILIMAPTERQSFALFNKTLQYMVDKYPTWIRKGKHKPTQEKIKLTNGVTIWCLPVGLSGLGIRFLTIQRLYAEEAARIPDEVWVAATPMLLTTAGAIVALTTPAGTKGYAMDIWFNRNNAFPQFTRFAYSSREVIESRPLSDTWSQEQRDHALAYIASEQQRMSKQEFAQEYLGLPMEDLFQVFSDDLLKKTMTLQPRPVIIPERKYFMGVDIARMGDDVTAFEIIDGTRQRLEHVESKVTRKTLTTATTQEIISLDKRYNCRGILIDDGGMGVGVFDQLLATPQVKRKVAATYSQARALTADEKRKKRVIKEEMYNHLLMLMEQGRIALLHDQDVWDSLKSVQFEIKDGKARYFGTNMHIADALVRAAWAAKTQRLNLFIELR